MSISPLPFTSKTKHKNTKDTNTPQSNENSLIRTQHNRKKTERMLLPLLSFS